MDGGWSKVIQTLLDFLTLKDSGVGPVGVGAVIILTYAIWLYRRFHVQVVEYYKKELSRVGQERDKLFDKFFDEKLMSSNDEYYSSPSEPKDEGDSSDNNSEGTKNN